MRLAQVQQETWTGKERTLEAPHAVLLACFGPQQDSFLLAAESLRFPTVRGRNFRLSSCNVVASLATICSVLSQGKPGLLLWQNPIVHLVCLGGHSDCLFPFLESHILVEESQVLA